MIDIPDPVFGAAVTVLGAFVLALVSWSFRTVRGAALVVAANEQLKATVATQRGLIDCLQEEVDELRRALSKAQEHITQLERIVGDLETRLDIRDRHKTVNP